MSEFFGGEQQKEKEVIMTELFDRISNQKFEDQEEVIVVEETPSSTAEVTKTIAVQRLIEDEYLTDQTFKALKIEESYKDSIDRYIVIETGEDADRKFFEVHCIKREIYNGLANYQKGESKTFEVDGKDAETLSNIAKMTKFKLSSITEQLER